MEKINIRKRPFKVKWSKLKKKKVILTVFVIFMILALLLFTARLRLLFADFCYMRAKIITIQTVNEVIVDQMEEISYEDLVSYEKDVEGDISLIKFNTVLMNNLSSKISLEIQKKLSNLSETEIKIPLGTVLGNTMFADYGPKITAKIEPSGNVDSDFQTEFKEARNKSDNS